MSTIYKKYVKQVSAYFPIKRKSERKYIRDLRTNVYDYCMEQNVTSMDVLYQEFGTPYEVAGFFYSSVDTARTIKHIRISRFITTFVIGMLLTALISATAYGLALDSARRIADEQMAVITAAFE